MSVHRANRLLSGSTLILRTLRRRPAGKQTRCFTDRAMSPVQSPENQTKTFSPARTGRAGTFRIRRHTRIMEPLCRNRNDGVAKSRAGLARYRASEAPTIRSQIALIYKRGRQRRMRNKKLRSQRVISSLVASSWRALGAHSSSGVWHVS